jgi:hypothetical protein
MEYTFLWNQTHLVVLRVGVMMFNNISVIWWRLVLLVEETREHGENHRPVASH